MSKKDPESAEKFRRFINAFIKEEAMLTMNKKMTLKKEKVF